MSPGQLEASRVSTSASTRPWRIALPTQNHNNSCSCSCLQQQAQLVYRLDELKQSHDQNPTIDSVLQGVQLAHEPWQALMRCRQCTCRPPRHAQATEVKEVFLLFAMSIRTLLCLLRQSSRSRVGVSVGSSYLELSGQFKAQVMDHLLSREALQSITTALRYLQEHTGRPKHLPPSPGPVEELGSSSSHASGGGNSSSSSSNNTWESAANGMLFSSASSNEQHQMPLFRRQTLLLPAHLGADTVASLLDTLQCTMQAMGQELKGS